jgi:hypothetical protein
MGAKQGNARAEETPETRRRRVRADPDYQKGYVLGRREADEQWAARAATVYSFGLPSTFGTLDDETGLTRQAIAGCMVTPETEGRASGHNARIAELIAERGMPSYSRLRFMSVLNDLEAYSGAVKATIVPNGPEVALEAMRVRATRSKAYQGAVGTVNEQKLFVWLGDRWLHGDSYGSPAFVFDYGGENASEGTVQQGPAGSDMLIFVWRGDPDFPIQAEALDLRTGKWLVVESSLT